MLRTILIHKAKDPGKLMPFIIEDRNEAMKQKGYITGETLVDTEDPSKVIVMTTWQSPEDRKAWDTSEKRLKLKEKIDELLEEPYQVSTYQHYLVRNGRVWSAL
ncbi:antibiotic biosynthesis monooxygenase family protein [Chloroflexota bacterium]